MEQVEELFDFFLPIALTAAIAPILFVPVVLDPSFACESTATVRVNTGDQLSSQHDSTSYAYDDWRAYFQTGVNYHTMDSWTCNCPAVSLGHYAPCSVAPMQKNLAGCPLLDSLSDRKRGSSYLETIRSKTLTDALRYIRLFRWVAEDLKKIRSL